MLRVFVATLLLCLVSPIMAAAVETGDPALDAVFEKILDRDFAIKGEGVAALAASENPKAIELLRGLLEGRLRYLKKNKRLVVVVAGINTVPSPSLSLSEGGIRS